VIDADKVAHQVTEPGTHAHKAVMQAFGTDILDETGRIDRAKLSAIVFSDPEQLGRLEQIVHPAVFRAVHDQIEQLSPSIVILEAVKLLEARSMHTLCDEIWVVVADPAEQVRRAKVYRDMSEAEARRRMNMQSPQAAKMNQADVVIDNGGSLVELYEQLDQIWAELQQRYASRLREAAG
jgi:dephospho-CoA kinase